MFLILEPGGTLTDVPCAEFCVFKAQEDMETMQAYAQVSTRVSAPFAHLPQERHRSHICNCICLVFVGLQQAHQALQIFGKGI